MLRASLISRRLTSKESLLSKRRVMSTSLGKVISEQEAKKYLQFTCTYSECKQVDPDSRVVKKNISTMAYEKGVVLVRCNCDKLHLIADRLVSTRAQYTE